MDSGKAALDVVWMVWITGIDKNMMYAPRRLSNQVAMVIMNDDQLLH